MRTLAEPNLTALSGQEASFLAGGEYPVPVAQEEGAVTVEYKPFGVELNFIPRVVDGDLINIELEAAVSSLDPSNGFTQGNFSIDAFRRRETSTTVDNTGDEPILTDGPFAESKEWLGGFWIIEAPDLDAALAWARKGSAACQGPVEVRPFQAE